MRWYDWVLITLTIVILLIAMILIMGPTKVEASTWVKSSDMYGVKVYTNVESGKTVRIVE